MPRPPRRARAASSWPTAHPSCQGWQPVAFSWTTVASLFTLLRHFSKEVSARLPRVPGSFSATPGQKRGPVNSPSRGVHTDSHRSHAERTTTLHTAHRPVSGPRLCGVTGTDGWLGSLWNSPAEQTAGSRYSGRRSWESCSRTQFSQHQNVFSIFSATEKQLWTQQAPRQRDSAGSGGIRPPLLPHSGLLLLTSVQRGYAFR